jgi:hypothetical protein
VGLLLAASFYLSEIFVSYGLEHGLALHGRSSVQFRFLAAAGVQRSRDIVGFQRKSGAFAEPLRVSVSQVEAAVADDRSASRAVGNYVVASVQVVFKRDFDARCPRFPLPANTESEETLVFNSPSETEKLVTVGRQAGETRMFGCNLKEWRRERDSNPRYP